MAATADEGATLERVRRATELGSRRRGVAVDVGIVAAMLARATLRGERFRLAQLPTSESQGQLFCIRLSEQESAKRADGRPLVAHSSSV